MERKRLKVWDYVALVIVIFAFILQVAGYFLPTWWSYNDPAAKHTVVVSMIGSNENDPQGEKIKTVIEIEGGMGEFFRVHISGITNDYKYVTLSGAWCLKA